MDRQNKVLTQVKYTIFRISGWGYFGLAGSSKGLVRMCLALPRVDMVKGCLLNGLGGAGEYERLYKGLQGQISAYFSGAYVNFDRRVRVDLGGFSPFTRSVLTVCRDIRFGQTISYGRLAKKVGRSGAARAVGAALAKNPLPLIIPCHRVVRSDGEIGGFSAAGGVNLKKRMLELEHQVRKT